MSETAVTVSIPIAWKVAIFTALVFAISSVLISTLVKGPEGPMGPQGAPGNDTATNELSQMNEPTPNFSHIQYSQQSFWDIMQLGSEAGNFADYLDTQFTNTNHPNWFKKREDEHDPDKPFHLWNIFWWLGNLFWDNQLDKNFEPAVQTWIDHYVDSLKNDSVSEDRITRLKTYLNEKSENGGLFDAIYNVAQSALFTGVQRNVTFGHNIEPTDTPSWVFTTSGTATEVVRSENNQMAIAYSTKLHTGIFNYEITLTDIIFDGDNGWIGLVKDNNVSLSTDNFGNDGLALADFDALVGLQFAMQDKEQNIEYYPSNDADPTIEVGSVEKVQFGIHDNSITLSIWQTEYNNWTPVSTVIPSTTPVHVYIVVFDNVGDNTSTFSFKLAPTVLSIKTQ